MREYNIMKKLAKLEALVLDVDGVLTGGGLHYFDNGGQGKVFDVKDGLGLVALGALGVRLAIITGKRSDLVERRAGELRVEDLYQGYPFKVPALEDFLVKRGLDPQNVGFVGDDVIDIPAMRICGFSACPSDAVFAVRRAVDWVARDAGGAGCLREIAEMILSAKTGHFPPDEFLFRWAQNLEL
ncbi:MAG TPA: phenylphosphate carboxylase subunit delta [candidate division Zixibacteria bacterium]|nr:phenylphosphate carboxylase subunit delta [candidate division Zixibacteria bacterium]